MERICKANHFCNTIVVETAQVSSGEGPPLPEKPSSDSHSLSCFTHGCSTGWVTGVLGEDALAGGSWLAALPCLVALPAAPFFGVLADARGRKAGALCISLVFILSCSLAAWCGQRGIWAARIAAGLGGAGALCLTPLYCTEIAPRTRGLTAMPALACSCGILFAYIAGPMLSAHALSLSMAVAPSVLLLSLLWIPETPTFLISIGKMQDAARVMCWFNGSDFREDLTDVIEQQEVRIRTSECYGVQKREGLRRQDSETYQPMLKKTSGLESNNSDGNNEQSAWKELFRHRSSRRALASCIVLLTIAAGSGAGAVSSFVAGVLKYTAHSEVLVLNVTAFGFYNRTNSRSIWNGLEVGSVFCGTALVLGAALATIIVDKFGRKMLLIWSCSGIACCLALLGVYCDPRLHMFSWSHIHKLFPNKLKNHNLTIFQEFTNKTQDFGTQNLTQNENFTQPEFRIGSELDFAMDFEPTVLRDWVKNTTEIRSKKDPIWPPVILLSMVMFLYNVGLGSVPFVLVSELFPANTRTLASSLLISWMWVTSFILLRYYGTLVAHVGLYNTYYMTAGITVLGLVYTWIWLPETRGKTLRQIDEVLQKPLLNLRKSIRN